MNDIYVDGEKLKVAMEEKGLTMTTLAWRARVSDQMLQDIMNGKGAISFLDMTRIAGLLGVGSNELMKQ